MKHLIIIIIFSFISNSLANDVVNIKKDINKIDWSTTITNVLEFYNTNNVKTTDLEIYTKEHGETIMYLIAEIETDFRYNAKSINPLDKSVFQIHTGTWTYKKLSDISKLNIDNIDNLTINASILAAHIWLYHICLYRNKYKEFPKDIISTIMVYHKPLTYSKQYEERINTILQRNSLTVKSFKLR